MAAGRQLRETHPTAHSPRVGDPALAGPPRLLVRSGDRLGLTSAGLRDANPKWHPEIDHFSIRRRAEASAFASSFGGPP
jgi:hypothetical protein